MNQPPLTGVPPGLIIAGWWGTGGIMATGAAKSRTEQAKTTADRLISQWPKAFEVSGLPLLRYLKPTRATRLANQLLAALPAGRLGPAEANRLRTLLNILRILPARPDWRVGQEAIMRYSIRIERSRSAHLPEIESALGELAEWLGYSSSVSVAGEDVPIGADRFHPWSSSYPADGSSTIDDYPDEPAVGKALEAAEPPPGTPLPPPPRPPGLLSPGGSEDEPAQPDQRFFAAEVEDYPQGQPLRKDDQYTIAFSVGPSSDGATSQIQFSELGPRRGIQGQHGIGSHSTA